MNKLWASDLRNPLFIPTKGLQVTCCNMKIIQQVFTKDGWLIWNQVDYFNILLGLSVLLPTDACLPILCSFHMSVYLPTLFYRSYYPSTSRSIWFSFVFFPFVWFPIFLLLLSTCSQSRPFFLLYLSFFFVLTYLLDLFFVYLI